MPTRLRLPILATVLYATWTFFTWWFEGRISTLQRLDAASDRLVYALVVNLFLGIVVAFAFLRMAAPTRYEVTASGLGPGRPRPSAVALAVLAGLAGYASLGAPTLDPIVFLNAYTQVFVVTAAEILVCWSLPAAAIEACGPGGGWRRAMAATILSAVLFGVYHAAHSPPFNTMAMIAFLTVVGLVTGLVFTLSRDAYATMIFHNFLGTLGVTQALDATGGLAAFGTIRMPLLVTAATAFGTALLLDVVWFRRPRRMPS
jgi:hypothetical protein